MRFALQTTQVKGGVIVVEKKGLGGTRNIIAETNINTNAFSNCE